MGKYFLPETLWILLIFGLFFSLGSCIDERNKENQEYEPRTIIVRSVNE